MRLTTLLGDINQLLPLKLIPQQSKESRQRNTRLSINGFSKLALILFLKCYKQALFRDDDDKECHNAV